jgi:pimeloyl-ACP methyl ester carboxylesterase
MSGWSWDPVVERMQQYHCLVPDLPQYGKSFREGPFEVRRAAEAVAELIRTRAATGRAHVVGFSLGAQVGVQLLASEPGLVDRAVLSGAVINTMPGVRLTQLLLGRLARTTWYRWVVDPHWNTRRAGIPFAQIDDYREDLRLIKGTQRSHIVVASAGFTPPEKLDESEVPTLFITGAEEMRLVRRWAATLAKRMPNGIDGIAVGMRHDWPLRHPDLFSRAVDGWLSLTPLPPEIRLSSEIVT